jgi:MFS superfamily sulfate permease-like transporter
MTAVTYVVIMSAWAVGIALIVSTAQIETRVDYILPLTLVMEVVMCIVILATSADDRELILAVLGLIIAASLSVTWWYGKYLNRGQHSRQRRIYDMSTGDVL